MTFAEIVEKLKAVVRGVRPARNEKTYQDRIERALRGTGLAFTREEPCGRGKVDFFVEGVLVEVKTSGSPIAAARQAIKYCVARPDALGVLIVHTRGEAPDLTEIGDRPVEFLNVAFSSI
jgi:hypothetical protein